MAGPIVCLLPARNAAEHVLAWLASVERFADAVVALDDGSTDDTGDVLRRSALVADVLTNPRRETVVGWNDAENRARLLAAAGPLSPSWIMQLDADQRMPADDARAFREFLLGEAEITKVYCFRVYRMVDDLDHFDPDDDRWLAKCFAHHPDHRLPTERLHLVSVPTAFTGEDFVRTTFRIQHLAGLTAEDRRAHYDKYRVADPERRYQATYEHLLREPVHVRAFAPRSVALAPLAYAPVAPRDDGRLSVFVRDRVRDDRPNVAPRADVDVIVTADGAIDLARTTSEFLVAPVGVPEPGFADAILRVHRLGYALVGGIVRTNATTASGWAAYVLEHFAELPGTPSGRLDAAPAACSYARDAWTELPTNPERFARGYSAYRTADAVTVVPGACRTPTGLAQRSWARGRTRGRGAPMRTILRAVRRAPPDLRAALRRAMVLIAFGATVEWLAAGYEAARRHATRH